MKIVITVFGNIQASEGTVVRAIRIAELIGENHEVTLVPKANRQVGGKHGGTSIWALRIPVRAFQFFWWNLKLSYVVLRHRPDIVYCSSDYYGFPGLLIWSKIRRYRLIYEAINIVAEDLKECHYPTFLVRTFEFLERFIIRHAAYVIAISPRTFQYCRAYNRKVEEIPLFVDDDLFKASAKINKSKDSKRIGLIGPFIEPRKRDNLRFLYSNLDKFDERIRLVVIGHCDNRIQNGRIEYTGYLDSVHDYVDQLSHLDAVFVPETMSTTGTPNKIIEPMSCSVPVFTTPKGLVGMSGAELGRDILVFEENDLVDKVNELVFDDDLMTVIGNNARKFVERHYSKKAVGEKLKRVLQLVSEG